MPSTIIASSSSRILRAPRSAAIAEPPAPAIRRAVPIGAACWITASTEAEPVKDWAPNCLISPPTCSAMTAPNGMATSAVGHDRDRGDEPRLLDELTQLERSPEERPEHVEGEGEEVARDR